MLRCDHGEALAAGQRQQADFLDELPGVVPASVVGENQGHGPGRGGLLQHFIGQVFEPGLQVFAARGLDVAEPVLAAADDTNAVPGGAADDGVPFAEG